MDSRAILKHRWRRILASPLGWLPFVLGCGGLLVFSPPAGPILGFLGLACMLGRVAWGLTIGAEQITQQAVRDLQADAERTHLEELRNLRRKLRTDKDQRTGQCLRDLRDLYLRMQENGFFLDHGDMTLTREVKDQARQLYDACLASLERSYKLWRAAQDMATDDKRRELVDAREKLIEEVTASIANLGRTVDHLQTASLADELPEEDLSRVRLELEQGLEVARNVQRRMEELGRDLRVRE